MKSISIIGAGSWGTALAVALGRKGRPIKLWAYEPEVTETIQSRHENTVFLPGVTLPPAVTATNRLEEALYGAGIVLTVMPSHVCRGLFARMLPALEPDMIFVSATKGIDTERLMRMSEIIRSRSGAALRAAPVRPVGTELCPGSCAR